MTLHQGLEVCSDGKMMHGSVRREDRSVHFSGKLALGRPKDEIIAWHPT